MTESTEPLLKTGENGHTGGVLSVLRKASLKPQIERWHKALEEHGWDSKKKELEAATGENRMRVQVCPRGCSYQNGRRDIVTRTRLSGKADICVKYGWETSNCPKCGTIFQRECGRCERPIFLPVADRCESCGLLQPWADERRATANRSQLRQWRPSKDKTKNNASRAKHLASPRRDRELFVIEGDITKFAVDAVISDDDTDGRMWAAVASSIKSVTGVDVERDSVSRGPYPLGSAWFTLAGNLRIKGIIHVASMDRKGRNLGFETIQACVQSALTEALNRGVDSVALAAIGTWPQNIHQDTRPQAILLEDWLQTVPPEIVKFLRGSPKKLAVLLVLFEPDNFNQLVELIRSGIDSV
jgi:hypothetical protein